MYFDSCCAVLFCAGLCGTAGEMCACVRYFLVCACVRFPKHLCCLCSEMVHQHSVVSCRELDVCLRVPWVRASFGACVLAAGPFTGLVERR